MAGLLVVAGTPAQAAPPSLPGDLALLQTRHSLLGVHTWYQQTYRGLPVFGGYYATHTATGAAITVDDGRKPVTGLSGTSAGITAQRTQSTVAGRLGAQPRGASLVVVPGRTATLAWLTLTPTGRGTVRSLLDAGTGAVLREESTVRQADGKGQVFDPNPVVALQDESLTDNRDKDSAALDVAYRTVPLTQLDADKTTLQGAYASPDTAVTPWACVMDWDATYYTTDTPHCLRRTDGPKVYPGDLDGEVHDDGEIWSHALWDVNRALGRVSANRIILEAQFSFAPDVTMPAAAQATVTAARDLYGPQAELATRTAFQNRGILS